MRGNMESLKKDVDFMYAILEGHTFQVDNKLVSNYTNANIPANLRENMEMITDFYDALKEIAFVCDKRAEKFTPQNWRAVEKLISIYHRKIRLKADGESEWCNWWWDDKVIPLLIVKDENGKII